MVAVEATSCRSERRARAMTDRPADALGACPAEATRADSTMMPGSTIIPMPTPMPARILLSTLMPSADSIATAASTTTGRNAVRRRAQGPQDDADEKSNDHHRDSKGPQYVGERCRDVRPEIVDHVEGHP